MGATTLAISRWNTPAANHNIRCKLHSSSSRDIVSCFFATCSFGRCYSVCHDKGYVWLLCTDFLSEKSFCGLSLVSYLTRQENAIIFAQSVDHTLSWKERRPQCNLWPSTEYGVAIISAIMMMEAFSLNKIEFPLNSMFQHIGHIMHHFWGCVRLRQQTNVHTGYIRTTQKVCKKNPNTPAWKTRRETKAQHWCFTTMPNE